jgi:UDP-2,3-diacylglucosamine pyrophosphatase LpxH
MKKRTHYRAIFISDSHLGFRGAQARQLLSFLKSVECDTLYLVGDILDLWEMKKGIQWDEYSSEVLRRLLKMVKAGTRIVYLPGNHDDQIRNFIPFVLGSNIEFVDTTIHTTSSGLQFSILHGDQYDVVVGNMKWLAVLGHHLYDILLKFNGTLHFIRTKLGYHEYWSLAGYLKSKAKKAVSFIQDFEKAVLLHAEKDHSDGVICGHIHTPKIFKAENGLIYANCGDWVESLTALVENAAGDIELLYWHDLTHDGIEDHVLEAVTV